jgi:protein-S-isoprenylcysteine O-methyltransferase Ste14
MVLNLCALTGFLLLLSADFLAAFGKKQVAGLSKAAGYCLVTLSFVLLTLAPPPQPASSPPIDAILILPGIVVAALSAYFLLRTVFLEFPKERKKSSLPSGALVQSGSYGLCRHPGFWWFSLLALDLAALRGFGSFLGSAILLITLNFILILVQDVYLFPKIFDGYDDYRKSVPFLFPRKRTTRCGGE